MNAGTKPEVEAFERLKLGITRMTISQLLQLARRLETQHGLTLEKVRIRKDRATITYREVDSSLEEELCDRRITSYSFQFNRSDDRHDDWVHIDFDRMSENWVTARSADQSWARGAVETLKEELCRYRIWYGFLRRWSLGRAIVAVTAYIAVGLIVGEHMHSADWAESWGTDVDSAPRTWIVALGPTVASVVCGLVVYWVGDVKSRMVPETANGIRGIGIQEISTLVAAAATVGAFLLALVEFVE